MHPVQPNPHDEASPYEETIPFMDSTPSEEVPSGLTSLAAPFPVSSLEVPSAHSRLSPFIASLLVVLVFFVIAGSGIVWYASVSYPATLHAQATAVVQNILQSQKQAIQAAMSALTNSPASLYASISKSPADIVDPLSNPDHSLWLGDGSGNTYCHFSGQTLHVKAPTNSSSYLCYSGASYFNNFAFQVQTSLLRGMAVESHCACKLHPSLPAVTTFISRHPVNTFFMSLRRMGLSLN